jgi:GTPase involved in cell partitioning and DNA repair
MLLKGTDGVVFLADSSRERMFGNLECCTVLYDAFAHYDVTLADVPISLQCNKRDLADALPLDTLGRELFPESSEEPLAVSAVTGAGLLDGLNSLARQIMRNLGQSDAVAMVGDEPAAVAETPQEELPDDHCNADQPGFRVESAGDPQTAADGTVTLPLRLTGGACGKSVDFKVTVSVSI